MEYLTQSKDNIFVAGHRGWAAKYPENTMEGIRAAVEIIVNDRKASISYIQRRLKIGYNKAASVIEILEKRNIIGPQVGTAPREILIDSPDDAFPPDTL